MLCNRPFLRMEWTDAMFVTPVCTPVVVRTSK